MFKINKDLKALNTDLMYDKYRSRKFIKEHGFDITEIYNVDISLLCFLYTRLKAYREYTQSIFEDTNNLYGRIDELLLEYEKVLENLDVNLIDMGKNKKTRKLINRTLELINECWW